MFHAKKTTARVFFSAKRNFIRVWLTDPVWPKIQFPDSLYTNRSDINYTTIKD